MLLLLIYRNLLGEFQRYRTMHWLLVFIIAVNGALLGCCLRHQREAPAVGRRQEAYQNRPGAAISAAYVRRGSQYRPGEAVDYRPPDSISGGTAAGTISGGTAAGAIGGGGGIASGGLTSYEPRTQNFNTEELSPPGLQNQYEVPYFPDSKVLYSQPTYPPLSTDINAEASPTPPSEQGSPNQPPSSVPLPGPLKGQNTTSIREKLMAHIFSNYLNHERPTEMNKTATVVEVNLNVQAIFSIDVRNMDYHVDAYLRQFWRDPRLAWSHLDEFKHYKPPLVSAKLKAKIWLPDLFFRNGKDGYLHRMTVPNYLLRVKPDGDVLYSQKITMRFSCQMDLQTFPMDTQNCEINIGSYGYTLNELKFTWQKKRVELADNLKISEFNTPVKFVTIDCSATSRTSTGNYTCLKANFMLKRQLGSYLATTYIPNTLIIMVSWLSFWVNVDSAPARVTLGLLTLLGILTQATSISNNLPRVSYIKAIDIWMIFSILFIIGVLVEYALAITMLRRKRIDTWHQDVREIVRQELARWCTACQQQHLMQLQSTHNLTRGQVEFCEELETLLTCQVIEHHKEKNKAVKSMVGVESEIDAYSRFLFPACYLLYNCFYWLQYLVLEQNNHTD